MATAQCPARARGMASSKTSIEGDSQTEDSMFKQAKLLVHFQALHCNRLNEVLRSTKTNNAQSAPIFRRFSHY